MNKTRPCLVVTNDIANEYSRVITIVPLTTTPPRNPYPWMVEVPDTANMPQQSWVHCGQVRSLDKGRLRRYYTSLDSATMRGVNEALIEQLGISPRNAVE